MNNYQIRHVKADTFPGATIELIANTSEDFTLTGAAIKMQLRLNTKTGTVALELTESDGITITGEKTFEIDRQIIDIAAGIYYADINITLANNEVYTPITILWTILQDVTQ
jgi:hypothetical protein